MDMHSHIGIITTMYMHVRINPAYLLVKGGGGGGLTQASVVRLIITLFLFLAVSLYENYPK